MRQIGNCLLLLALAPPVWAEITIPVVGRPKPFYNAAGNRVTLEATAEPRTLTDDDALTYTLTVRGLLNAADVQRPDLHEDDAFRKDWQCDPDLTAVTEPEGTRIFRYRLRALRRDVTFVPAFTFPYYAPEAPRPFRTTRVAAIPITLVATPKPPKVVIPLEVPNFAERLAIDSSPPVPDTLWLVVAIGVPGVLLGGCVVWGLVNPTSFRAARRRRHRAARAAIKQLRQQPSAPQLAAIVAQYLAGRFHSTHVPQTPQEVACLLQDHLPPATQAPWVELFHTLDERRFAPPGAWPIDELVTHAIALIEAQEEHA